MEFSTVTIDGTKYTVAYDFNSICQAEELTGTNLLSALENLGTGLTAAQLRGLWIAGLEAGPDPAFPGKSPQQSLEIAGELIRLDTIGPITVALAEAYSKSIPGATEAVDAANVL